MSQVVTSRPDLERDSLLGRLESSQERLCRMLRDVPEQLSTVRTAENRWSIREVVEHLVLCEYRFLDRVKNAETASAPPDFEKDAAVLARGLDRSQRRKAPDTVLPSGQFLTLENTVSAFKAARLHTMDFVRGGSVHLRHVAAQGPLGEMDGYQLLLMAALHTERHTLQIDDIKNDPAYRK